MWPANISWRIAELENGSGDECRAGLCIAGMLPRRLIPVDHGVAVAAAGDLRATKRSRLFRPS